MKLKIGLKFLAGFAMLLVLSAATWSPTKGIPQSEQDVYCPGTEDLSPTLDDGDERQGQRFIDAYFRRAAPGSRERFARHSRYLAALNFLRKAAASAHRTHAPDRELATELWEQLRRCTLE